MCFELLNCTSGYNTEMCQSILLDCDPVQPNGNPRNGGPLLRFQVVPFAATLEVEHKSAGQRFIES